MNGVAARSVQRGFTLIELMIVVAIIGILASIALPAYEDYTVKVRVSEALRVTKPIKAAVAIFTSNNSTLPTSLSQLGYVNTDGDRYAGDYVSYVTVSGPGQFDIHLKTIPQLGAASGLAVYYDVNDYDRGDAVISWRISGTVPVKFLPKGSFPSR